MNQAEPNPLRVVVVGASARAAANALRQIGIEPIAADLFADTDTAEICPVTRLGPNYEGAETALRAAQADAWIYTGGLENRPALVDRMAAICPLWGNGGDVLRRVRDPRFVPAALAADGLRHLPVAMGRTGLSTDGSWLKKPIASAGGGRIERWLGRREDASPGTGCWYYQRYLEGESLSAVFVASREETRLRGVTRQLIGVPWTGARDFWYCGSIGPLRVSDDSERQWRRIGDSLARRGGLLGMFGVDAVVRGEEIWPVEINPRYPASAEILDGVGPPDCLLLHMAAIASPILSRQVIRNAPLRHPSDRETRHCWGKAILFAEHEGAMPDRLPQIAEDCPRAPLPRLADLPAAGSLLHAGEPVLTVFAAGEDEKQVEATLRQGCGEVQKWLRENS